MESGKKKGAKRVKDESDADLPKAAKKQRAAAGAGAQKREGVYRPTASKQVRDRMARVKSQRMYLVSSTIERDADEKVSGGSFAVLGSTGNVYDVLIGKRPSCRCPDFERHQNPCKHLLFVFLKVLGVAETDPVSWQKFLLTDEVHEALRNADRAESAASVLANAAVRETYAKLTGKQEEGAEEPKVEMRDVDDDCPICFEAIKQEGGAGGGAGEALVVCPECRRPVHADCFNRWKASKQQSRQPVTCVYCRAAWREEGKGGALPHGVHSPEGFVNMGALQGQDQERDESTYAEWFQNRHSYRGGRYRYRGGGWGGGRGGGRARATFDLTGEDD